MNRHRHRHRPRALRRPSTALRRGLRRARSFTELHDRLRLVECAHHLGHLDIIERDELLALHDRRLHDLARGGARW